MNASEREYEQMIVLYISSRRQIIIRPKQRHESYPTHEGARIVLGDITHGNTVHYVKKYSPLLMVMELKFEPEKRWQLCPCCKKKNWSAWMPVQLHRREVRLDGTIIIEDPFVQWYIVCIHCAGLVSILNHGPYPDEAYEYVYDPADNTEMKWAAWDR